MKLKNQWTKGFWMFYTTKIMWNLSTFLKDSYLRCYRIYCCFLYKHVFFHPCNLSALKNSFWWYNIYPIWSHELSPLKRKSSSWLEGTLWFPISQSFSRIVGIHSNLQFPSIPHVLNMILAFILFYFLL